jgi:hypothetical protein
MKRTRSPSISLIGAISPTCPTVQLSKSLTWLMRMASQEYRLVSCRRQTLPFLAGLFLPADRMSFSLWWPFSTGRAPAWAGRHISGRFRNPGSAEHGL